MAKFTISDGIESITGALKKTTSKVLNPTSSSLPSSALSSSASSKDQLKKSTSVLFFVLFLAYVKKKQYLCGAKVD